MLRDHILRTIQQGHMHSRHRVPTRAIVLAMRNRAMMERRVEAMLNKHIEQFYNPSTRTKRVHNFVAEDDISTCYVCMEMIKKGDDFMRLACSPVVNHLFHSDCLKPWFQQGKKTCPTCRSVVVD